MKDKQVWFDAGFGYFVPGEIVDKTLKCIMVQTSYFGKVTLVRLIHK